MSHLLDILLGRLGWDALPFWEMLQEPTTFNIINGTIVTGAASLVVFGALALVALITWFGKWRMLWTRLADQCGSQEDRHHVHRGRLHHARPGNHRGSLHARPAERRAGTAVSCRPNISANSSPPTARS